MSQIQKSFLAILAILATALLVLAANPSFSRGLIQSSCAPWDGPAIAITLASETPQCERAPSGPYLSLGVWRGLPLRDGQVVKFGSGTDNGYASRCAKENDCQRADSEEDPAPFGSGPPPGSALFLRPSTRAGKLIVIGIRHRQRHARSATADTV